MSGKSKKTTADHTSRNQYQNHPIFYSAAKAINHLSQSFYGENTLKKNKQFILDTYEEMQYSEPCVKKNLKSFSYSKKKLPKPKTPVIQIKKEGWTVKNINQKVADKPKQKQGNKIKIRERSSSRSSNGKSRKNNEILKYLNNRIDTSAKGWNTIKALMKHQGKNNN